MRPAGAAAQRRQTWIPGRPCRYRVESDDAMLKTMLASGDGTMWMPPQASTVAANIDNVFYYILYVSAVFFVIINGAMFYFMWKYRRRSPHDKVGRITHSTPLEIGWSVIPGLLLIPMFWWGFQGYMHHRA